MQSQTEENYLKAICLLSEFGTRRVNTNDLAHSLENKPSSVTVMIKRLSERGFLSYEKYKGVNLTTEGKKAAMAIIRKHRLWETFLVEALDFSWDEVHETAEQLEHVRSPLLIDRLDKYLGYPDRDPHGDPIPNAKGEMRNNGDILLSEADADKPYKIVRVSDSSDSFLKYLNEIEINLDTTLTVIDRIEYDDSMKVKLNNEREVLLSGNSCNNIYVNQEISGA